MRGDSVPEGQGDGAAAWLGDSKAATVSLVLSAHPASEGFVVQTAVNSVGAQCGNWETPDDRSCRYRALIGTQEDVSNCECYQNLHLMVILAAHLVLFMMPAFHVGDICPLDTLQSTTWQQGPPPSCHRPRRSCPSVSC